MPRGVLLVAVCFAVACGAGSGASAATSPRSQVALMPLGQSQLGSLVAKLPLANDSGTVSNSEAAANANGHMTAAKLAGVGRITGYQLDYGSDAPTGAAISQVQTRVELYRSGAAAAAGLALWRKDEADVPKLKSFTVVMKPFAAGVPRSWGYYGSLTLKGKPPFYGADIDFQVGSVLGSVTVAGGAAAQKPLALEVARKLRARIVAVLAGRVSGRPVPLPGKAKAGPPAHGPNLAKMALAPSDLGAGTVGHEGYQVDTDLNPVSEYERELHPAGNFAFV
ncbi:MAG TPA: hypothetical protein VE261_03065, partial [Gaiellaceae bacterium]|nr:hypothetical protein [Gaiellaceae bacterium]